MKEYAFYKGDTLLCIGTAKEIAEKMKVKVGTIYYYKCKAYQARNKKNKYNCNNRRCLVLLEGDEE